MKAFTKPATIEEFRTTVRILISATLKELKADFDAEQVNVLTDEIIYVGCPHIFGTDADELSFADDVLDAGDCLLFAEAGKI